MRFIVKKKICVILAVILLVSFSACEKRVLEKQKFSGIFYDAFDTMISVTAYCYAQADFDALFKEAQSEFLRYHKLFDIYNNYDGIANAKTINDNAGKGPVAVDPEIIDLLLEALRFYDESHGEVNVLMGSVLKIWHEAREYAIANPDAARVPERYELLEAAKHCDKNSILIDENACTVQLLDPLMSIDLGAVAKGYATERVAQKLIAEGHDNILISAGGNARAIGAKPDGSPWIIAVQNPDKDEKNPYAEKLSVIGLSAVTSGNYERFYEVKGIRYHHIIDCDTLMPENNYKSVTIITENSAYADALSTAVFNMELEDGLSFINAASGTEAMWILASGEKIYSDGFLVYIK